MFHIHPGGLFKGSGNGDYSLMAATGHEVIVSINYRLGIFGFLANSAFGRMPATMASRISSSRCAGCSRTSPRSAGIRIA